MKLIYIIIFSISLCLSLGQINTEVMRTENDSIGIKNNLSLDFSYFSGSSEIIQLTGSYRLDYRLTSKWYGFLTGYYNRAFEKDKEDFSNRRFIHFRMSRPIISKVDIEGFLQKEKNHFINLENRELIGGGFRINQFGNLYFGIGVMHEMEKYNENLQEQQFVKSTNYINYKSNILQAAEIQNVIYYQFKIETPGDYRILWDGNVTIHASDKISFHININYRFDNNGESYFEFSNGIGFQF